MAKTIIEKKTRPDGTKYVLVKLSHDTEKIRPLRKDQKPYEPPKPALSGKSLKPYANIASTSWSKSF